MKPWILAFVLLLQVLISRGQSDGASYTTAAGLKFFPGAVTVKHFLRDTRAVEGLLSFWEYGFRTTALYEIHGDINGVPGLKWYAGPGAHLGFWNNRWRNVYPTRASGLSLGIDGVLGLDYKVKDAPLNFSLDWQPSLNIIGYSYFEGAWGGLSIRYTLN